MGFRRSRVQVSPLRQTGSHGKSLRRPSVDPSGDEDAISSPTGTSGSGTGRSFFLLALWFEGGREGRPAARNIHFGGHESTVMHPYACAFLANRGDLELVSPKRTLGGDDEEMASRRMRLLAACTRGAMPHEKQQSSSSPNRRSLRPYPLRFHIRVSGAN